MSADFAIGFGACPDRWSCTRGMLGWVQETVAGHVQDADLAARLRELAESGYQFMNFSLVDRERVPELVQAMIDALIPAAEREHRDDPEFVSHARELVDLVARWRAEHSTELAEWSHDEALAASRRQLAAGVTMDEVLTCLRAKGFFEGESVLAVMSLIDCDHLKARKVVVHSQTWADQRVQRTAPGLLGGCDGHPGGGIRPRRHDASIPRPGGAVLSRGMLAWIGDDHCPGRARLDHRFGGSRPGEASPRDHLMG